VVLEYDSPTPIVEDNLAAHWVFGLSARNVRDVVVGGETVVRDRSLTRVSAADLRRRSREAADGLWRRMDEIDVHTYQPEGGA
jgi:cytosine/adenosine deaminase-related metal-dependent hydrolase